MLTDPKLRSKADALRYKLWTGGLANPLDAIEQFSMVRDLEISVPPLSLQVEFAGMVRRVEGLRARMAESERQVEGLFESLLAEAFNA